MVMLTNRGRGYPRELPSLRIMAFTLNGTCLTDLQRCLPHCHRTSTPVMGVMLSPLVQNDSALVPICP